MGYEDRATAEFEGVELAPEFGEGPSDEATEAAAIIEAGAAAAARVIVEIAQGDSEDPRPRTQFDAARYVLDRVLGTPSRSEGSGSDPWAKLIKRLDSEAVE